ncbi:MAG: hypothetical protein ACOYOB_17080 [Myxococcota bacterium]
MRQREHLRRLGIGAVDEDERRERIGQGKAAELAGVEFSVDVAAGAAWAFEWYRRESLGYGSGEFAWGAACFGIAALLLFLNTLRLASSSPAQDVPISPTLPAAD